MHDTSVGLVFFDEFGMEQEHREPVTLTEHLLSQDFNSRRLSLAEPDICLAFLGVG
jgi:hypothetical protein